VELAGITVLADPTRRIEYLSLLWSKVMKLERDFPNNQSQWKLLLVAFLFGVLASFLAIVVIACK